jgi:hypothetical protein
MMLPIGLITTFRFCSFVFFAAAFATGMIRVPAIRMGSQQCPVDPLEPIFERKFVIDVVHVSLR